LSEPEWAPGRRAHETHRPRLMPSSHTRIPVGLEQGSDGYFWAHPLGMMGCAAAGISAAAAVAAFEVELQDWLRFVASAGGTVPPAGAELELAVDEWIETDAVVGEGESTALFAAEVAALSDDDLARGMRLLGDLRGSLLSAIRALPRREADAALDATAEGGWSVRQVLEELARAQWWTLSRLGATPMAGAADATLARLDTAMALVVQHLAHLPQERRSLRLELDGEEWTPRKVLRRLLWLEWTLGRSAARALAAAT
jgi:hypothetical protein